MNRVVRHRYQVFARWAAIAGILIYAAQPVVAIPQSPQSSSNPPTRRVDPPQSVDQKLLRAILSNPKDVESQQTQHSLQYSPQEIARAIQDLDQQIAANSTDPRLYYERGFLKYKSGQYLAAKEDFEQILKTINPNDDIAYFHIGLSYYGLYGSNQKNSEYLMQATKNISKAIELDRNGWLIWWREQRRNRDIKALENKIKEANAFLEKNQKSNARKKVYAAEAVCKTSLDRSYRTLCRQVNNLLKRV